MVFLMVELEIASLVGHDHLICFIYIYPKLNQFPQLYHGVAIYEGDIGWNFFESMNVLNWSKY